MSRGRVTWLSPGDTLHGTVDFCGEGGYPERFLDAAAVPLWRVRRRGDCLTGRCRAADYRALRTAARRASLRLRVTGKHGLPFRLRPFRHRWGLAVGAVLAAVLLGVLSSRVWVMEITGDPVDETALRAALAPLGVREGASWHSLDLAAVQTEALHRLPALSYIGIRCYGCRAEIEVRERTAAAVPDTAPSNLVASCDGVVLSVTAAAGEAAVRVGDAVTEGSLLIGGVCNSKVGPRLCRAEGVCVARVRRTVAVTVPLCEVLPAERTAAVRAVLEVFSLRFPLDDGSVPAGTAVTDRHPLTVDGRALPLGVTLTRYRQPTQHTVRRTAAEAETEAQARLDAAVAALPATVTERRTDHRAVTPTGVTLTAEVVFIGDVCRRVPLQETLP